MFRIISSLFGPLRIYIPGVVDLVYITDPEQIKRIEKSGAVDRLHVDGTEALPSWIRIFFRATRFYDAERDLWFLSLESDKHPDRAMRYQSVATQVAKGYTPEDVETIADLLEAKADDETLGRAMTQIVNRRFLGEDVPRPVTRVASHTLERFFQTALPWKYFPARTAQKEIMNYCAQTLNGRAHLVDVGHNIGEVMQTTSVALRRLYDNLDTPVEKIFTQAPLTTRVPRIATRPTTFNGLLWFPTSPGQTVFIFRIDKAARKSKEILFTFGTGRTERACVFKDFFLKFMTELQTRLRDGATTTPATP